MSLYRLEKYLTIVGIAWTRLVEHDCKTVSERVVLQAASNANRPNIARSQGNRMRSIASRVSFRSKSLNTDLVHATNVESKPRLGTKSRYLGYFHRYRGMRAPCRENSVSITLRNQPESLLHLCNLVLTFPGFSIYFTILRLFYFTVHTKLYNTRNFSSTDFHLAASRSTARVQH